MDPAVDRRHGEVAGWARRLGFAALAAAPALFVTVMFAWPLTAVLSRAFGSGSALEALAEPRFASVAWFTLWQALLTTALTLVVALPVAYVVGRYDFPGRRAFMAFTVVPFVMPTMVVATAFLALLRGPLDFLGWDRGIGPMILAQVYFNLAVVIRIVGQAWSRVDERVESAARMLGASRLRTLWEITLPLLAVPITNAAALVFLFSFTSFGVALVLSDFAHPTIEVEIYRQAVQYFDLAVACSLALLQMLVVALGLWLTSRWHSRIAAMRGTHTGYVETARLHRPRGGGPMGVIVVAALVLAGPLVVLVWRSLHAGGGSGWSVEAYRSLFGNEGVGTSAVSAWAAIGHSVGFALLATAVALVVGVSAAVLVARSPGRGPERGKSRRLLISGLDLALMLPLGTSAVTVGLGYLLVQQWLPRDVATSWVLVPLVQAVVAVPFVVRIVVPAIRGIDERQREAATMLGASPTRVWREVDAPIVARATGVAAGFCAAISLGEFGATVFVARPEFTTMPLAIQRFASRPGELNIDRAMAMSVILMLVTAAIVLLVERGEST